MEVHFLHRSATAVRGLRRHSRDVGRLLMMGGVRELGLVLDRQIGKFAVTRVAEE